MLFALVQAWIVAFAYDSVVFVEASFFLMCCHCMMIREPRRRCGAFVALVLEWRF